MEVTLFFFGRWVLLVEEIRVTGAASMRLRVGDTFAADGSYLDPQPGLEIDANGREWWIKLDVSFDLQPFQHRNLRREFVFEPVNGLIAVLEPEGAQHPAFQAYIRIRCLSRDPEIRTLPSPIPYDFTIPERAGHGPDQR